MAGKRYKFLEGSKLALSVADLYVLFMGLFLSLSGVIGSSEQDVRNGLANYAAAHNCELAPSASSSDASDTLILTQSSAGVSILYPADFLDWDDASAFLSQELNAPVFSFHIHDDDLWMLILFVGGEEVAHFNPIPDYWDEISQETAERWQGDPEAITRHIPAVSAAKIARYFKRWDLVEEHEEKAYQDDEFNYGDAWQLSDFMRRVGLTYPIDNDGKACGNTFRFQVT